MKKITIILIALIISANVNAADYYIAQSAAGSGDGSSCANADAIADLTWGTGNMVKAADTLHLCGTITSTLTIGASGSEGSVITVIFETGAKFSKGDDAAWGGGEEPSSSAAIYGANKSYITIDGNDVGVVENTDNGTGLGVSVNSHGVVFTEGSNITVKDLTIKEIYKRTARSDTDSNAHGVGIWFRNVSSGVISGNTIYGSFHCIAATASSGNPSNLTINDNDLSQMSTGIKVALDGATNYSNINIYRNKIYDTYVWDGSWGAGLWHHRDGIHTWGNYSSNTLGPLNIYGNEFSGDWGAQAGWSNPRVTGFIYITDYTTPVTIYNNLFAPTDGVYNNGWINLQSYGAAAAAIYNNTFAGITKANTGGVGIYFASGGGWTADIQNNIICTLYIAIYDYTTSGSIPNITTDYNAIYNVGSVGRDRSAWYSDLAKWRTKLGGCAGEGNECSSITTNPALVGSGDYSLSAASPAINVGADLSDSFTTDLIGNARPTGVNAWDLGAYEYGASPDPKDPPTTYTVTVSESGDTGILSVTGERTVVATDSISVTATRKNGWNGAWSGTCPSVGSCTVSDEGKTGACESTPIEACWMKYTATEIPIL